METILQYITDGSEKTTKIHWVLTMIGLFWYLTAIITTWLWSQTYPESYERNPVAAQVFQYFGMIPTFLIVLVLIVTIMISIPYIFRQKKQIGLALNACLVIFFILDGSHNLYLLTKDILFYFPHQIIEQIMYTLGL
jgi:hypothetical protein